MWLTAGKVDSREYSMKAWQAIGLSSVRAAASLLRQSAVICIRCPMSANWSCMNTGRLEMHLVEVECILPPRPKNRLTVEQVPGKRYPVLRFSRRLKPYRYPLILCETKAEINGKKYVTIFTVWPTVSEKKLLLTFVVERPRMNSASSVMHLYVDIRWLRSPFFNSWIILLLATSSCIIFILCSSCSLCKQKHCVQTNCRCIYNFGNVTAYNQSYV